MNIYVECEEFNALKNTRASCYGSNFQYLDSYLWRGRIGEEIGGEVHKIEDV